MDILERKAQFNRPTPDRVSREGEALRKEFLHLGRELHRRGEFPTAQFCAEMATLPPDIAHELLARMHDFTRISISEYVSVGADKFPDYLVPLDGGRS